MATPTSAEDCSWCKYHSGSGHLCRCPVEAAKHRSAHHATILHHANPDRPQLVWESAHGPVVVADMTAAHLTNALRYAETHGIQSPALPAMRARLAELTRR